MHTLRLSHKNEDLIDKRNLGRVNSLDMTPKQQIDSSEVKIARCLSEKNMPKKTKLEFNRNKLNELQNIRLSNLNKVSKACSSV